VTAVRIPPFLVLVVCLVACSSPETSGTVRVEDRPLPELAGTGLNGEELSAADELGHVVVVSVWATWCYDCERDMPGFANVADRYSRDGVRFLGVNPGDNTAQALEWVRNYRVPYPSISDPSGRFAASLGYVGMPATYVVDRDGTIRFSIVGAATSEATLSGLIDQVLAGSGSVTPSIASPTG
jgi:thiol-disulfide isomerase/thioredoxin